MIVLCFRGAAALYCLVFSWFFCSKQFPFRLGLPTMGLHRAWRFRTQFFPWPRLLAKLFLLLGERRVFTVLVIFNRQAFIAFVFGYSLHLCVPILTVSISRKNCVVVNIQSHKCHRTRLVLLSRWQKDFNGPFFCASSLIFKTVSSWQPRSCSWYPGKNFPALSSDIRWSSVEEDSGGWGFLWKLRFLCRSCSFVSWFEIFFSMSCSSPQSWQNPQPYRRCSFWRTFCWSAFLGAVH